MTERSQVEAIGVGQRVDRDDAAVDDAEGHDRDRQPAGRRDQARARSPGRAARPPPAGRRSWPDRPRLRTAHEHACRDRRRPAARRRGRAARPSASKSPPRAAARKASTTSRCRARSASGRRRRPAPGGGPGWRAAGSRPACGPTIGAISSKGTREHVVQHEREPLGGRQRLEHDQQRQPDGVGEHRLLLGVDRRRGRSRSGPARAPSSGSSRRVLRERSMLRQTRGGDRRQPAAEVLDVVGVGAAEPRARSPARRRRPR